MAWPCTAIGGDRQPATVAMARSATEARRRGTDSRSWSDCGGGEWELQGRSTEGERQWQRSCLDGHGGARRSRAGVERLGEKEAERVRVREGTSSASTSGGRSGARTCGARGSEQGTRQQWRARSVHGGHAPPIEAIQRTGGVRRSVRRGARFWARSGPNQLLGQKRSLLYMACSTFLI